MNIRYGINHLKNILLYGGLSKDDYAMVQDDINTFNRKSILFYSYSGLVIFTALLIYTCFSQSSIITKNKLIYLVGTITFLLGSFHNQFYAQKNINIVRFSKYSLSVTLLAIGIVLAINSYYDVSASYMVILFMVPLLMLIRPVFNISFIIVSTIIYLFCMYKLEDSQLFSKNCTNAIIYGCASIFLGTSFTMMRIQKYKTDYLNRKLMLIDILTNLYNRHAYTELMNSYSNKQLETDLIYISLDLNGLKTKNDSFGHTAGDELLCAAADCMKKVFSEYGNLFRIGGDEFAVILHGTEQQLIALLEKFKNEINEHNKAKNDSLSISYGYALVRDLENCSFEELAYSADVKMYEDKNEYYKKNKIERRQ